MNKRKPLWWILAAVITLLVLGWPHSPVWELTTLKEIIFALGATAIIFVTEITVVGWNHCALRKILRSADPSHRTDMMLFIVHLSGIMSILTIVGSFGASYFLGQAAQNLIRATTGLNLRIDTGNGICNFFIYYLLYSFLEYWSHRLFHTEPFWQLHKLHHSATSLNPMVMHRAHPANLFLDSLLRSGIPIALVAAPGYALTIFFICASFYQLLVHSGIPWDWGWFGKWVLISPRAHKLHHSIHPAHYGKNLSVLAVWDHIFGTWYDGDVPVEEVGLNEEYHSRSLIGNCVNDMMAFLKMAKKRIIVFIPHGSAAFSAQPQPQDGEALHVAESAKLPHG